MVDPSLVEKYRKARRLARGTDNASERSTAEGILRTLEKNHPGIGAQADAADKLDEVQAKLRDAGFDPGSPEASRARKQGSAVPSMKDVASLIRDALSSLPPDVDILDVAAVIDHVFRPQPGAGVAERIALAAWRKLLKSAAARGDLGDLLAGFNPFASPVEDDMATSKRRTRKNGEKARPRDLLDVLCEKAELACDDPEDKILVFEVTIPAKLWEKVQEERKGPETFVRWVQACLDSPAEEEEEEEDDDSSSDESTGDESSKDDDSY